MTGTAAAPLLTLCAIRTVAGWRCHDAAAWHQRTDHAAAPLLLIDLETGHGVTGMPTLFCYTGMVPPLVAAVLADIQQALAGERIAPADLSIRLARRYRLLGTQGIVRLALADFDVACWDALARAACLPLESQPTGRSQQRYRRR